MPRITAGTVAEHHARQRRALLDAARSILASTGVAPTMSEVGRRAGLARSSVYQYFASPEELLEGIVADVFPEWARSVLERVAAASTPGDRVWAYIEANIDLFDSAEQAVARALSRIVDPQVLMPPMKAFHVQLQIPLRQALEDLGEHEPEAVAEHIDAIILQASRAIRGDGAPSGPEARAQALARVRRMLSGYLQLPTPDPVPPVT
ncbi:TetR/AcrR family transcriptional regulator [Aeromicrobium wangtongii]|uniref:TetR/AcrR family transcriptional regulator n=1 Tax=Aeromicrobium wangtongii TaxID=2969247 RepID=A0ABY5MA76_9ACTN|nr:TetR/AcrR family transcriptional regulator [Aeromicrobium wangtongii]MCD9199600.1 TetR/AcrR family transcriptional regulator [Aeromicrobium wangtongii]UUP13953.1 TetR/AcrR family transcriptional regulator [Aeromicrobium wangtongii]